MSLKLWLEINAFIGLFFGLLLLLAPQQLVARAGLKLDRVALMYSRSYGGGALGFALINWAARDYAGSTLVWYIVGANIILHLIAAGVDYSGFANKTYKKAADIVPSIVLHLILAGVFAYYLIFTR